MEKGNLVTAYTAAFITIVSGMTVNEFVALGGLLIGLATFVINWLYKHKNFKLEEQRTAAIIKQKGYQHDKRKENHYG